MAITKHQRVGKANQIIGSCLDYARDLAGCVQGPQDLSTNPAHIDHYGR